MRTMDAALDALLALGRELRVLGYRFTTISPASHARVNARGGNELGTTLADVFGWSRPFRAEALAPRVVALLAQAGELARDGELLRSRVRFSTLDPAFSDGTCGTAGVPFKTPPNAAIAELREPIPAARGNAAADHIFVHSAFPTEAPDSVFFGPDTYRFARALRGSLAGFAAGPRPRIVDLGCGSGVGGLYLAALLAPESRPRIVLADINPKALRYAQVNAALNGVPGACCVGSDLWGNIEGPADFIISNPPYLVDAAARAYRHGGGNWGFALSLRLVAESLDRLAPGGRFLLYTGAPIVGGVDLFREALSPLLARRGLPFAYEEIDPDVFGEELAHPPYDRADRIAVVALTIDGNAREFE